MLSNCHNLSLVSRIFLKPILAKVGLMTWCHFSTETTNFYWCKMNLWTGAMQSRCSAMQWSPVDNIFWSTIGLYLWHVNIPHTIMKPPNIYIVPCWQLRTIASWGLQYTQPEPSVWNNWKHESLDHLTHCPSSRLQFPPSRDKVNCAFWYQFLVVLQSPCPMEIKKTQTLNVKVTASEWLC